MSKRANSILLRPKLAWCDPGLYTDIALTGVRELVERLMTLGIQLPLDPEMRMDWPNYLRFIRKEALPVALQGRRGPHKEQHHVISHYESAWARKEDQKGKRGIFLLNGLPYRCDANLYRQANIELVTACANKMETKSILEVGCGSGHNLELLSEHGFKNGIFGLKPTKSGTQASLQRLKGMSIVSYKRIVRGTALALPFSDNTFDLVFTHHVVEQLKRYKQALIGELARVTRRVLICVEPFGELQNWIQRRWLRYKDYFDGSVSDFYHDHLKPIVLLTVPIQNIKFRVGLLLAWKE